MNTTASRASRMAVPAAVIGPALGLPWAAARTLLHRMGIRTLSDGPRRWLIDPGDWDDVRARLGIHSPTEQEVPSA